MNLLIAYGTSEGQTRKVVDFLADNLGAEGHEVRLFDTSGMPRDLDIANFDRVIMAGSVHEGRHQQGLELFALAGKAKLEARPVLFVSVSLAAAFDDTQADAEKFARDFTAETGFAPSETLLVAGAVKPDEYGFYNKQILRHEVLEGRHADDVETFHEFTDWQALKRDVDAFMAA